MNELIEVYGHPQIVQINADDPADRTVKVMLIPADAEGHARSAKGDFLLTAEDADRITEEFKAHGVDLPIDYEHHSVPGYQVTNDAAPAAGWIM